VNFEPALETRVSGRLDSISSLESTTARFTPFESFATPTSSPSSIASSLETDAEGRVKKIHHVRRVLRRKPMSDQFM
jgi:hypothetical protein